MYVCMYVCMYVQSPVSTPVAKYGTPGKTRELARTLPLSYCDVETNRDFKDTVFAFLHTSHVEIVRSIYGLILLVFVFLRIGAS